jgi:ABC-2 type transport system permease protein
MTAGMAIQATTGLNSLPISPWAGLGMLAAWAAAADPRRNATPEP